MASPLPQLLQIAWYTCVYWASFVYFWLRPQLPIGSLTWFGEVDRLPLVHVWTLANTLSLWNAPHYRARTFADDLRANLANVAIPGTGIPLSVFCYNKATALAFILLINPLISLVAAVCCALNPQQTSQQTPHPTVASHYRQLLLFPSHWFAVWRHNCMLVGLHALVSGSDSYRMEHKGTFLLEGQRLGLPVSPFFSDAAVFVKHVSIEGGMGIHVFRNFAHGGEWVIQRALSNSPELSRLLPPGAPLSTLRVVTASTAWLAEQEEAAGTDGWLQQQQQQQQPLLGGSKLLASAEAASSSRRRGSNARRSSGGASGSSMGSNGNAQPAGRVTPDLPLSAGVWQQDGQPCASGVQQPAATSRSSAANGISNGVCDSRVRIVTAVWRAGLAGKDTDHSSICFPVNLESGEMAAGVSANGWYKLGLRWLGRVDKSVGRTWLTHPDSNNVQVAGAKIANIEDVLRTVRQAHSVAMPDVPLVGWDVALTPGGVYLLEANLSCNLFSGHFDSKAYYASMFQQLESLQALRHQQNSVPVRD